MVLAAAAVTAWVREATAVQGENAMEGSAEPCVHNSLLDQAWTDKSTTPAATTFLLANAGHLPGNIGARAQPLEGVELHTHELEGQRRSWRWSHWWRRYSRRRRRWLQEFRCHSRLQYHSCSLGGWGTAADPHTCDLCADPLGWGTPALDRRGLGTAPLDRKGWGTAADPRSCGRR